MRGVLFYRMRLLQLLLLIITGAVLWKWRPVPMNYMEGEEEVRTETGILSTLGGPVAAEFELKERMLNMKESGSDYTIIKNCGGYYIKIKDFGSVHYINMKDFESDDIKSEEKSVERSDGLGFSGHAGEPFA